MVRSLMASDRCWKMPHSCWLLSPLLASTGPAWLTSFMLGFITQCWCRLPVPSLLKGPWNSHPALSGQLAQPFWWE